MMKPSDFGARSPDPSSKWYLLISSELSTLTNKSLVHGRVYAGSEGKDNFRVSGSLRDIRNVVERPNLFVLT